MSVSRRQCWSFAPNMWHWLELHPQVLRRDLELQADRHSETEKLKTAVGEVWKRTWRRQITWWQPTSSKGWVLEDCATCRRSGSSLAALRLRLMVGHSDEAKSLRRS